MKPPDNSDSKDSHGTKADLPVISKEELVSILRDHETWLSSRGRDGTRALLDGVSLAGVNLSSAKLDYANLADTNLEGAICTGASFTSAVLVNAKLDGADLAGANLEFADCNGASFKNASLAHANLRGADLSQIDMRNALLTATNLREALLMDADLSHVKGLLGEQLSMADVTGSVLPDPIAIFDGLDTVKEASQNARKLFFGMLLACGYTILTVATIGAGMLFYQTTKRTLQGKAGQPITGGKRGELLFLKKILFLLIIGAGLFAISFGGIYNTPGFIPRFFQFIGFSSNVNLSEADISTPPASFDRENPDHLMFVKGASLARSNLRHAILSHAFLVKADLRGADLKYADLRGADLREAQLWNISWSTGTKLDLANIDGVHIKQKVREGFLKAGAVEIQDDQRWREIKTKQQIAW